MANINEVRIPEELLLSVRKPARYIGCEINSITKDWDKARVRFCLCFPDLYEIGMSNLGIKILYHILNRQESILCERCFTPWIDMEKVLRDNSIPLFSLENKMPLKYFDILGFSFSYELSYTNMLTMLDLSGIPFLSAQRKNGAYPLIIAGGSCVVNPEPLSEFVDIFVIGDGEDAAVEIANAYDKYNSDKSLILRHLSQIEGVYVPAVRSPAAKVVKRVTRTLEKADFPTKPIVAYIEPVHDRITVEIMRGCPNNCYFCQARSVYGPVRLRDKGQIRDLAKESYRNTGLDEVSLLSLSSASYPGIEGLITELTSMFLPLGVGISLPSLRIEESTLNIPSLVSAVKKSGLTFAPEAATDRMLKKINKNIEKEKLFAVLKQAFSRGWRRVKLYFMIGLPDETDEDVRGIIDFARAIDSLRREVSPRPVDIVVSVSSFIPKPHTFFQRQAMADPSELLRKQAMLLSASKKTKCLKLKFSDVNTSVLEAVFSRGDKGLGRIIRSAWEQGARFDAWSETFNPAIWDKAFEICGIDKKRYLGRKDNDEALPWSHIVTGH
ncbi:MAG: TIGR03960 family B12-binding radical SAM protein [Candidatus Omnitrophica bacterium]|nr:TIGR03960 family B12-binding radical SAM protein [Candidatus Omnitrophota bacterium]